MAGPNAAVELILKLNTFILNGPPERNLARTAVLQDIVQAWETDKEVTLMTEDSFTLEQDVGSYGSHDDLSEDYRYMDTDDMLLRDDEPVTSRSSLPSQPVTKPLFCARCGYDYRAVGTCKDCPNCPRKTTKLKRKARFPKEERSSPNVRADSDGVQTASDLTQYPRQSGNDRDDTRSPNQRNLTQNIVGAKFQAHPHKMRQNKSRGDSQMTKAGPSIKTSRQAKMQRYKHHLSKSVRAIHSPHKRVQNPVRWSPPGHSSHDSQHDILRTGGGISIPNVPIQTTAHNAMSVAGGSGVAGGESPRNMTNKSPMGPRNRGHGSFTDISDLSEHDKLHNNTTPAHVTPNLGRNKGTVTRQTKANNRNTPRADSKKKIAPGRRETSNTAQRYKVKKCFVCADCNKSFDKKCVLLDHIRMYHTFEKPFQCEQCDQTFSTKSQLRAHTKKHHDVPSTSQAAEQPRPQTSSANTEPSIAPQSAIQLTINIPPTTRPYNEPTPQY